jgi:hypothetical protein
MDWIVSERAEFAVFKAHDIGRLGDRLSTNRI